MTLQRIPAQQNKPAAVRAGCAFQGRYITAKRWHALRVGVGLLIGTLGVLLTLVERSVGDYVGAAGAVWIVLSRTLFQRLEQRAQREGADAHELFDTEVLELPPNPTLSGPPPAIEDLRDWGAGQDEAGLRAWYPDVPAQHPLGALICQRASLKWAATDHHRYAVMARFAAIAILVSTVVIAVAMQLEVGEYLLRLGLPVMPAVLDLFDVASDSETVGERRGHLAVRTNELYDEAQRTGSPPGVQAVRDLQDGMYVSRCSLGVPQWVYKLSREQREANMAVVTGEQVAGLPVHLR